MLYFHSWSGGKDSTAGIILDHLHNLPPSRIVMSEVMFDLKRGISGELPEHMEWVHNVAIPLFKSWGYETEIIRGSKDYLSLFYHVIEETDIPERKGKYAGWLLGGRCAANRTLKTRPIGDYYKQFEDSEITQYVGIAIDEPERLAKLEGTNKVSLLQRYGYTEQMAHDLCKEYNLLSPIYEFSKRGGCWFCPNQKWAEFAHTRRYHPELWAELEKLNQEQNVVSRGFKWGKTLEEVTARVDQEIANQEAAAMQLSLFDFMEDL